MTDIEWEEDDEEWAESEEWDEGDAEWDEGDAEWDEAPELADLGGLMVADDLPADHRSGGGAEPEHRRGGRAACLDPVRFSPHRRNRRDAYERSGHAVG